MTLDQEFMNFIDSGDRKKLAHYRNLIIAERQQRDLGKHAIVVPPSLLSEIIDDAFRHVKITTIVVTAICLFAIGFDLFVGINKLLNGNYLGALVNALLALLLVVLLVRHIGRFQRAKELKFELQQEILIAVAQSLEESQKETLEDSEACAEARFWEKVLVQIAEDTVEILNEKQDQLDLKLGFARARPAD